MDRNCTKSRIWTYEFKSRIIADKVEEANKGNGVIQVINLETGAYSFQTR